MYTLIVFKVAMRSLFANKLRSCLAVLGIIIGVAAVIAMLAVAGGANEQVMGRISAMGTNLLVVRPGASQRGGVVSGSRESLKIKDVRRLQEELTGAQYVTPVVQGRAQVKYYNRNSPVTLMGVSDDYFAVRSYEFEHGRPFTENEAAGMARVAVIGPTTAMNLMDQTDAIDAIVKVNGLNFKVIGVTKPKGDQGWFNPDDQIMIPYTTAMKQVLGMDYLNEIDIQGVEGGNLMLLQEEVAEVLRREHRLMPGDDDDFSIRNQAEVVATAQSIGQTFSILFGSVAGISLLVGGIGIMNIMLVTVAERTREIGIRKAIGAKDRDIMRQFLIESILMSALGGVLGIGLGFGIAFLIATFSPLPAAVQTNSIFMSLGFSAAVGIFFGYYPARRAAMLNPIEALRHD